MITEGGVLVLGQKQNVPGGQFESHQSFIGEMTNLQIWNSALSFSGWARKRARLAGLYQWITQCCCQFALFMLDLYLVG